jgi:site-specific recombinase XerC
MTAPLQQKLHGAQTSTRRKPRAARPDTKSLAGIVALEALIDDLEAFVRKRMFLARIERPVSPMTIQSTVWALSACYKRIWGLGYHLSSPKSIRPKHVDALVGSWIAAGFSPSAMKNSLSRLRQLGNWTGQLDLVSVHAEMSLRAYAKRL